MAEQKINTFKPALPLVVHLGIHFKNLSYTSMMDLIKYIRLIKRGKRKKGPVMNQTHNVGLYLYATTVAPKGKETVISESISRCRALKENI